MFQSQNHAVYNSQIYASQTLVSHIACKTIKYMLILLYYKVVL